MMYQQQQQQQQQTELEQEKLYGLIKEKINQMAQQFHIPKTMEQQIEKKVEQVAQQTRELFVTEGKQHQQQQQQQQQQQKQKEIEFDFFGMEKTTEKQELIRQVKDILTQVKDMITIQERREKEQQKYPEEFRNCIEKRVQHEEEIFRQIRDIQSQIDNLTMWGIEKQQEQEYGWEKRCEKPETVRRLRSVSPVRRQELKFEHEQPRIAQQAKFVQLKEQKPEMEILTSEWRITKDKQQPTIVKDIQPFCVEERKQLIEKLLQQVRILEEMLVEQYETVFSKQKFGQFHFELEKQLVEQIRKQITEIEKQFAQFSFELTQYYGVEYVQKEEKIFQLVKHEIRMIEDLFISSECFETLIQMPKCEKLYKQQQQELLEKVRLFKAMVQEFFFWTQQGKQQQQQQKQQPRREELLTTSTKTTTTTTTSEPVSFKLYSLLSLPLFCHEETYGKQSEKVAPLRKQLEELKIVKEELEMRLYETDRKVEQFKRQIDLLEQYPKGQYEQFRAEFPLKQTKPEGELIKICLKPQQEQTVIAQHHHQFQQQQPMMIKTRSFSGKTEQQQQQQIQPRQFF